MFPMAVSAGGGGGGGYVTEGQVPGRINWPVTEKYVV